MSGTTRIPVSLDNIDRFSAENARYLAGDRQATAILDEWFNPLFSRQALDESHPATRRRATVGERFNTLYIYHRQGNTDGFVGFYDYYRDKLTPQEKTSFDRLEEADKEIRLRAAVYAAAASSEPVLAMQTGTSRGRPTMEVMYPKAESTAEIPPEAFSLFARFPYSGRNYLNGVCIVNLIDFNGDGVQDLFVVYFNGQMKKVVIDNSSLEVFDFPADDTYELEIWTYKNGKLELLLHESSISAYDSSSFSHRNQNDVITLDYRISITVFENESGIPVLQKYYYSKNDGICEYENIYFSGEAIIRDRFSYKEQVFLMNDTETTWDMWIENVAGYDKILLSALIANSWLGTSTYLQEVYGMDYNFTLAQTERVIRYLSSGGEVPSWLSKWFIAEGEYLSLYMKELYRSNMLFCEVEESEKYFTRHHYALYDIDQNGTPELILYEGSSGAGTHFHIYTVVDGEIAYSGFYGRTSLYADNEGGLIAYYGRMNGYHIDLLSLEDGLIEATFIAGGSVTGEEPYPELDEFGYENFKYLAFCPPEISLTLYTYSQSLYPYWYWLYY